MKDGHDAPPARVLPGTQWNFLRTIMWESTTAYAM